MKLQRGASTLGMLILLSYGALVLLLTLKLLPVYLDDLTIKSVMEGLVADTSADVRSATPERLRELIRKRLGVNNVSGIDAKDIKIVREGPITKLDASYEVRTPMIANADVVLSFQHHYEMK